MKKGSKHSEETKKKMRKAKENNPCNFIKTKFKKGHIPWMKGKHHTKKARKKMAHTEFKKGQNTKANNHNWKDGQYKSKGYVYILKPNHPFGTNGGYIQKSHLVIEKQIKRHLLPKEVSHHLNKIRDDNHLENLMAFVNQSAHQKFHGNPDSVKSKEIIFDGRNLLKKQ